jgi:hypothetical protein
MKPEENIYNSICDVIDGLVDVSEFDENVYVEQTMKEYYNDQQIKNWKKSLSDAVESRDPEALCED